jgi:MoaA/NifB/PqqE/SkfB family radical SAM enzyme
MIIQQQEEILKRNYVKEMKPYVYRKMMKFPEKVARGESVAIIQFQYDYKCNFRCVHCSIKRFQNKKDVRKMSINDVKNLSKQADELGLARFVITGGEPLIFKDFDQLVSAIDPHKFYINCDTNGWFLDRLKVKHLKSIGVDRIQLSIDSLDRKEHDDFRMAEGSHERAMKAVDFCLQEGMNIFIQTVVSKQRLYTQEFVEFIKYFNKKNVGVFVSFAKPVGSWQGNFDVLINDNDLMYFENALQSRYKVFSHLTPSYGSKGGCVASTNILSINETGDVLPCIYFPVSIGNIFDESLKDILERAVRLKPFKTDICPMAVKSDFIEKYLVKTYNKDLPVDYREIFSEEDFING